MLKRSLAKNPSRPKLARPGFESQKRKHNCEHSLFKEKVLNINHSASHLELPEYLKISMSIKTKTIMVINSKKCLCQALFRRIPSCPFCTATFFLGKPQNQQKLFFQEHWNCSCYNVRKKYFGPCCWLVRYYRQASTSWHDYDVASFMLVTAADGLTCFVCLNNTI